MIPATHLRLFPPPTALNLTILRRRSSRLAELNLPATVERHRTAPSQHLQQQRRTKSHNAPPPIPQTNPSSSRASFDSGSISGSGSPGPNSNSVGSSLNRGGGLKPGGETLRQQMEKRAQQKALLEEEMKLLKKQMELIKKRKELEGEMRWIEGKLNGGKKGSNGGQKGEKMEGGKKKAEGQKVAVRGKTGLHKERGKGGLKKEVPALPLGHYLLVDEPDLEREYPDLDAGLEETDTDSSPLTTHRLTLVPQPPNTDLLSPAPPPSSLLIFACSASAHGSGISKVLETHYPRAYKLYKRHCMSIPSSSQNPDQNPDQNQYQGLQEPAAPSSSSHTVVDPNNNSELDPINQARKAALDKHQRSLVGTALLIRPPPSFVSSSSSSSSSKDKKDTNTKPRISESEQERNKKHFIGLLFISKESSTSAYRDPPVAILKATRQSMADLMRKVGQHNRRQYLNEVGHRGGGAAPEVPEDRDVESGSGGWGKTGIVGQIEEMRMAKDDISNKEWRVKWEMTKEVLGLEVKVPGEGSLPSGGEVKVFEGLGSRGKVGLMRGRGGVIGLRRVRGG